MESFDASFLFFTGDLDPLKSTRDTGPLLLTLVPLIGLGVSTQIKLKSYLPLVLLLASPLPAMFVFSHYESISRIFVFLALTYLAAIGLSWLLPKRNLLTLWAIVFLFEFTRFLHIFVYHYRV